MSTPVVTGIKELDAKLERLEKRDSRRVGRKALGKGLTVVARAIRKRAPVGKTKRLKKSVGSRQKKNRRKGIQEAKAGIGVGGRRNKLAPHGHLVGLGTGPRVTGDLSYRGEMPANPFVRQGMTASKASSHSAIVAELRKGLEKAARRK